MYREVTTDSIIIIIIIIRAFVIGRNASSFFLFYHHHCYYCFSFFFFDPLRPLTHRLMWATTRSSRDNYWLSWGGPRIWQLLSIYAVAVVDVARTIIEHKTMRVQNVMSVRGVRRTVATVAFEFRLLGCDKRCPKQLLGERHTPNFFFFFYGDGTLSGIKLQGTIAFRRVCERNEGIELKRSVNNSLV